MTEQALFALLHVLVFVYWLGGDLGAFYTSRFLTEQNVSAERRLMAAKIVGDVDMAPRTALILALPTGLLLAESRSWLQLGWPMIGFICAAALIWLWLAWTLHVRHGAASAWMRKLDLAIRWGALLVLVGWAGMGLSSAVALPLFLALKMILLAGCIALGLFIRGVLSPLGPALQGLTGADAKEAEASLATTLKRARPLVIGIWALLIIAAFLGLWTPTSF